MRSKVIAKVAAQIVAATMKCTPNIEHATFRVKNLSPDEVVSFTNEWHQIIQNDQRLRSVNLLVAQTLKGLVDEQYISQGTITYSRNHNRSGLVYLETEDQSDAQGIANFFTLRDSNFLDGSFDNCEGLGKVTELVALHAWDEVNASREAPKLYIRAVVELVELTNPLIFTVPIRKYAQFCIEVAKLWGATGAVVDSTEGRSIVGSCLPYLDMFPDPNWKSENESKTFRRLELNSRYADLRSSTGDVDADSLLDSINTKHFKDADDNDVDETQNVEWRRLCSEYVQSQSHLSLQSIPFYVFAQLFKKDSAGVLLGDIVADEILEADAERINEFEELGVRQGLNTKTQQDAEKFLSHQSFSPDVTRISDLLTQRTRKAVEKLAYPKPKSFTNPILETVRQLLLFQEQSENVSRLELVVFNNIHSNSQQVLGLFSFLFGATFSDVAQIFDEESNCRIVIDEKIISPQGLPEYRTIDDESEEFGLADLDWSPESVQFKWYAYGSDGVLIDASDVFVWEPESIRHLALFWILACDPSSTLYQGIGPCKATTEMIVEGNEWLNPFVQRVTHISALELGQPSFLFGEDPLADEIIAERRAFQASIISSGLSVDAIDDYVDSWTRRLSYVRQSRVPEGSRDKLNDAMLLSDSIAFGEGRVCVFPSHPFKLRWISEYFKHCRKLLEKTIDGTAKFATGDPDIFIDWLDTRSPRELPPLQIDANADLLFSMSQLAWFEEFSKLSNESVFIDDPLSLQAICKKVSGYIDAHPYKKDGLSILLVVPPSDQTVSQFISLLFKSALKDDGALNITVACERSRWESIARLMERLDFNKTESSDLKLFPSCQLDFVDFSIGMNPEAAFDVAKFDIAICIGLLNSGVQVQQNTEEPLNTPGSFHSLFDSPTTMVSIGELGSTSVVMKPANTDPAIEDWGTMSVRSNRARPVAPHSPKNVDFVELRQNFSLCASLFNYLHLSSHWVITLERHISRRQIESVEAGSPDVLSILDGIGSNGSGTLVVSSKSGRDFIQSRIRRKLEKIASKSSASIFDLDLLAKRIYDETRVTSPHLALNAMGISRVTEEILGLAVARSVADVLYPSINSGLSIWLSLDEYSSWFGGIGATRADLVRLDFAISEKRGLELHVLVVEGKLRQSYDIHGVKQAEQTRQFFEQVLEVSSDTAPCIKLDSELWREKIYSALEYCADQGKIGYMSFGVQGSTQEEVLRREIHDKFRRGDFKVDRIDSIYSCCLWNELSPQISCDLNDDVMVVKTSGSHIFPLVNGEPSIVQELLKSYKLVIHGPRTVVVEDESKVNSDNTNTSTDVKLGNNTNADGVLESDSPTPKTKRMSDQELLSMYEKILDCFDQHGVGVLKAPNFDNPYIEGPASILFKVKPNSGTDPKKLFEKADSLKLALSLANEQSIAFGIDKGYVTIDVPKSNEQRYFVSTSVIWSSWKRPEIGLAAPLGEDRFGQVVSIDFSSANSPHLLIGGTTGSGKSEALNTILYGLCKYYHPSELRLHMVDPKGTELQSFETSPHLEGSLGWDDSDAMIILGRAVDEMQSRYSSFRNVGARSLPEFNAKVADADRLPWWLIVLDEYADLTSDPTNKKAIEQQLKRLAQKARAAGIHLIIATQKPSGDVISTNLRSNLPAQLALRVKSGTESRVVIDETGAESLNGKGDALLKSEGRTVRVQCAKTD